MAACIMAKLRVGWIVAGCTPAVRTIERSNLFHSTTGFTVCGEDSAAPTARPVHRSVRKAASAHLIVVSRLYFVIFGIGYLRLNFLGTVHTPGRRQSQLSIPVAPMDYSRQKFSWMGINLIANQSCFLSGRI